MGLIIEADGGGHIGGCDALEQQAAGRPQDEPVEPDLFRGCPNRWSSRFTIPASDR